MFEAHLRRWNLVPDGPPIRTHTSDLLPVMAAGEPAMLKLARTTEEKRGNRLMAWWDGEGVAKVLARHGRALLLERASGDRSLVHMARSGLDREASIIICDVADRLHNRETSPPLGLVPLEQWFTELGSSAGREYRVQAAALAASRDLLASQRDVVTLHGDLHHGNVLDFGSTWRAIDPKGLCGERTFEFVNMLRNPDPAVATAPGRLAAQATLVAERARLDRRRLLEWALAFAGLSAAWTLADGDTPDLDLSIGRIVMTELGIA